MYNILLAICCCVKDNISTKFVCILMYYNQGCYTLNAVWLSCPSKDLIITQISTKRFFLMFKTLFKHFIRDNIVWYILSFQGSYLNVHLTVVYFLVLKNYWKIVSGTAWFNRYFPFQGLYQVFMKGSSFFSVSQVFKIFESQTIWFDLYHTFRKHLSIFTKSTYSKLRSR